MYPKQFRQAAREKCLPLRLILNQLSVSSCTTLVLLSLGVSVIVYYHFLSFSVGPVSVPMDSSSVASVIPFQAARRIMKKVSEKHQEGEPSRIVKQPTANYDTRTGESPIQKQAPESLGRAKGGPELSEDLIEKPRPNTISRTLKNIDKCMYASNLTSPALLDQSRQNAQLFMEQYGSVVSRDYFPGYINHCWNVSYSLLLNSKDLEGDIGKTHFTHKIGGLWFESNMRKYIQKLGRGRYSTSTLCLPNVYLLGFEKCGSTFFWCLLMRILNHGKEIKLIQADKEPYFWTDIKYTVEKPNTANLAARYVPMFLKGSDKRIPVKERKEMTFIDASPSTVIEWPKFTETEPELTNYCLLPSALPELFPMSKYLVIMRNPVSMMYSNFWWTLVFKNKRDLPSREVQRNLTKGLDLFHARSEEKISRFLNCINSYPSQAKCTFFDQSAQNYAKCITKQAHLLSKCVANITHKRQIMEAAVHRGIYYVHVRKWLQTVPRDRIFFTTLERMSNDTRSVLREAYKFLKGSELEIRDDQMNTFKNVCQENHNTILNYKTPELQMLASTKTMLEKFFKPFSKLLAELLEDDQLLWKT